MNLTHCLPDIIIGRALSVESPPYGSSASLTLAALRKILVNPGEDFQFGSVYLQPLFDIAKGKKVKGDGLFHCHHATGTTRSSRGSFERDSHPDSVMRTVSLRPTPTESPPPVVESILEVSIKLNKNVMPGCSTIGLPS